MLQHEINERQFVHSKLPETALLKSHFTTAPSPLFRREAVLKRIISFWLGAGIVPMGRLNSAFCNKIYCRLYIKYDIPKQFAFRVTQKIFRDFLEHVVSI